MTVVTWWITITGLYFWFNVGAEDRVRVEYGRVVWRHVDGGTKQTHAGVDGGASMARWTYEAARYDTYRITRIPLWMPFLFFVGTALGMTILRWSRSKGGAAQRLNAPPVAESQRE